MTLQERIRQVKGDICENRRQIAQLRLESIAGAENPYSLIQIFERGHQVTRNGATVYVTKCRRRLKDRVRKEIGDYPQARTTVAPPFYHAMMDIATGFKGKPMLTITWS